MYYIDENYKKVNIDIQSYKIFDVGGCGEIYRNKDEILKKYYPRTDRLHRLKIKEFNLLKQINHTNFIKLHKIYMICNKPSIIKRYLVDLYTAKYYQKEDITPAFLNKDYLLENFSSIENLFRIFSDNKIKTYDIKLYNTVFTKDFIVIIDPDLYELSNDKINKIKVWNKNNLFKLFTEILLAGLKGCDWTNMFCWIYDNFNPEKINENTDLAHELSKKLQYVKRPIEVIRK